MINEERIKQSVDKGEQAFWAAVAAQYPEATTGDLGPEMVQDLTRVMERAVRAWVDANVVEDSKPLTSVA